MELDGFTTHFVHILRPQNTESVEPESKNFGGKPQDKNDIILQNTIINERQNQINYMMQGFIPLFQDS